MTAPAYVARLNCGAKDGNRQFHIIVGVFSAEKLANESIENFIEGTLEMEYPNITVISQNIEKFELDQPIDGGLTLDGESIPF